jgi:predicted enzyme related to lactoylglutathione lyase
MAKVTGIGGAFPRRDRYHCGHFGWFTDPTGNRVELWQPK